MPAGGGNDGGVSGGFKRFARIAGIAIIQIVLIGLIVALLLANWMPAIYESDWFQERYNASSEQ